MNTISGHRITSARLTMPAWRCWYADVHVDGEVALTGRTEIVIADLTLQGAVLSGGPANGRSRFRTVAGAGGWGKPLKSKSYANDSGVKVSTVMQDAATSVGESFDLSTAPASMRVGPAFVRIDEEPASSVPELVAPSNWFVGNDGITRIGKRPSTPFAGQATMIQPPDRATKTVTLASESIASLVPGVVVDGIEAVDVEHELTEDALRTTIWGDIGAGASRRLSALRVMLDQLDPWRRYRGVYEFRVVSKDGKRLNLQPVRVSTGMPELRRVPARTGVAGCEADVMGGALVLVTFVDADPSRPEVIAYESPDGDGFMPTSITLAEGMLGAARMTDPVVAGPFAGTITSASLQVRVG